MHSVAGCGTLLGMTDITHLPTTYRYPSADVNPALVYLASLSTGSRTTVRGTLASIAAVVAPGVAFDAFPWHLLRYQHTQAIRAQLMEQYSVATANKALAFLRRVLKECWRLGYMTAEEYRRAADVDNVSGSTLTQAEKGRHIMAGELAALMTACQDGSIAGVRDGAIIAVTYSAGLRRSETASLQVADYNPDTCELVIRGAKRNKDRLVPIAQGACDWLDDWLSICRQCFPVAELAPKAIFLHIRRGDVMTDTPLGDSAIYEMLKRRALQAGVKEFTPHDLRGTFVGDLLDAGVDISTVQQMAGHASPTTTARYDRRGKRAKHDAARRLHVPSRRD